MAHYFENDAKLKSERKKTKIRIHDLEYIFYTDHGVFAKKGLDLGTHILLDTILKENIKGDVLDLGCGYGPIGICIKKEYHMTSVDMLDVNQRSLELARVNALENGVDVQLLESDGYEKIKKTYDYIISNPPIRVGKEKLYELLFGASTHLKENGELWIVIHKDQGAKTTAKALAQEYEVNIVNKSRGFFIIQARKR